MGSSSERFFPLFFDVKNEKKRTRERWMTKKEIRQQIGKKIFLSLSLSRLAPSPNGRMNVRQAIRFNSRLALCGCVFESQREKIKCGSKDASFFLPPPAAKDKKYTSTETRVEMLGLKIAQCCATALQ